MVLLATWIEACASPSLPPSAQESQTSQILQVPCLHQLDLVTGPSGGTFFFPSPFLPHHLHNPTHLLRLILEATSSRNFQDLLRLSWGPFLWTLQQPVFPSGLIAPILALLPSKRCVTRVGAMQVSFIVQSPVLCPVPS